MSRPDIPVGRNLPDALTVPLLTVARDGAAAGLLAACRPFGPRGLLVHGQSLERSGALARMLAARPPEMDLRLWPHAGGEPTLEQLEKLLAAARQTPPDWVAAVGGGSVLDVGKGCAGLLHAPRPVRSYHDGAPLDASRVPFIAVPTTAGTGSEATGVVVLTDEATQNKKSIRHASFVARLVILDPELLASCPPGVVAASGMDALAQAIESYVSRGASRFTDALCVEAMALLAGNLEAVFRGQRGESARNLLHASYLGGLALANARLGLVHGLAHPLGARYHVPHGLACAVCLPLVIRFNRDAMGAKYERLAAIFRRDPVEATQELLCRLEIRSPFAGKPIRDQAQIIAETLASGSTAANPRSVAAQDVEGLLQAIFAAG